MFLRRGLQWATAVTRWTHACSRWARWQGALSDAACLGIGCLFLPGTLSSSEAEHRRAPWGWGRSGAWVNPFHPYQENHKLSSPFHHDTPSQQAPILLYCCFVSGLFCFYDFFSSCTHTGKVLGLRPIGVHKDGHHPSEIFHLSFKKWKGFWWSGRVKSGRWWRRLSFSQIFARSTKEGETYRRLLGTNLHKGKLCLSSTKKTLKPCCMATWWCRKYWLIFLVSFLKTLASPLKVRHPMVLLHTKHWVPYHRKRRLAVLTLSW